MDIKANMVAWSTVFGCNVEVVRVYKSTATIRLSGSGLMDGKLMTFRGQRLDSLQEPRRRKDRPNERLEEERIADELQNNTGA